MSGYGELGAIFGAQKIYRKAARGEEMKKAPWYSPKKDFPKEYKRIIDESGVTLRELAGITNIKFKRLTNIIYQRYGMDQTEYRSIRAFVESKIAPQDTKECGV